MQILLPPLPFMLLIIVVIIFNYEIILSLSMKHHSLIHFSLPPEKYIPLGIFLAIFLPMPNTRTSPYVYMCLLSLSVKLFNKGKMQLFSEVLALARNLSTAQALSKCLMSE